MSLSGFLQLYSKMLNIVRNPKINQGLIYELLRLIFMLQIPKFAKEKKKIKKNNMQMKKMVALVSCKCTKKIIMYWSIWYIEQNFFSV